MENSFDYMIELYSSWIYKNLVNNPKSFEQISYKFRKLLSKDKFLIAFENLKRNEYIKPKYIIGVVFYEVNPEKEYKTKNNI
ncbi:MAG: hypothetical protein ACXAC2_00230 [Candidatus Kariarchaeaceae archaeon]|jgi:hypothetical protein